MTIRFIRRTARALAAVACLVVFAVPADAQLVLEPIKDSGQNVYPAFEGWYQNSDGTYTLLVGYFNRNTKETLDIPIGPENRIEPGGPDQGQPTHFLAGRAWGAIAIKVPQDFGDRKLTWTLTANGRTVSIPMGLTKGYQVEPFKDEAMGNTPPSIKLSETGPSLAGPPPPLSSAPTLTGTVGEAVNLTFWITDDAFEDPPTSGRAAPPARPRLTTIVSKYRGPGEVKIAAVTPEIEEGRASTTATFSLPGEYVIRIESNDASGVGGGGSQCCWTTAYVKVNAKGR